MKPLRLKIQEECNVKKLPQHVIEKDYALSYVLMGIAKQTELANSLVFKGGTALKKIFFGDYRFSEDLDFSTVDAPKNDKLEVALSAAANITKTLLMDYGPFDLTVKRKPERAPHPTGQEAFTIGVQFPWQRTPQCNIKIEVTHDEPVILSPQHKPILHGYGEELDCKVSCYPIEEIIAEKLRALLQTHKKLVSRGWNRPRARDYYDLWRILKDHSDHLNKEALLTTLDKKCKHRNVSYNELDDFFTEELIREANQHWQATLGDLIKDLPGCALVLEETRVLVRSVLCEDSRK